MKARDIMTGLATLLVAGATVIGIEKSGISRAEGEIRQEASEARWQYIPVVGDYVPEVSKYLGRLSFDAIPAFLAALATYKLIRRRD